MGNMKIRVEFSGHPKFPILVYYPYGSGESFEELTVKEAKDLIKQLENAIKKALNHGKQDSHNRCNEISHQLK